jgi:hypothetical protein
MHKSSLFDGFGFFSRNSYRFGACARAAMHCAFGISALTFCSYFPKSAHAVGQNAYQAQEASDKYLQFSQPAYFERGDKTSVAVHSSGLVVEFHKNDLWPTSPLYRIGSIDGNAVSWGPARYANIFAGGWPTVALSKEGYVIYVDSSSSFRDGAELNYRIGKIDPEGDINQTIEWKTDSLHWDGGFHSGIAINDNGVIVGVHESNSTSNNNLHYRVGHLVTDGDYPRIAWDSGHFGIRYDSGINPRIALNNHNEVVAVHQVTDQKFLHYRRGTISFGATGATIDFGESQRYDSSGSHPAVALLDNGLSLEVHSYRGAVYSRVGQPSPSDSAIMEWFPKKALTGDSEYEYPAIATNGAHAVEIHQNSVGTLTDLFYSVAEVGDLESSDQAWYSGDEGHEDDFQARPIPGNSSPSATRSEGGQMLRPEGGQMF